VTGDDARPQSAPLPAEPRRVRASAPIATKLERNSFAILGAGLRDSRQRLFELAEDRILRGDEEECNKARSEITNPRSRLAAEVSWLPGLAPSRALALLTQLRENPWTVAQATGLPALANANLTAAGIELLGPDLPPDLWAELILRLARAADSIDVGHVLRDLNEDRGVAGFQPILDVGLVQSALDQQRRQYKDVTLEALDRLPSRALLETIVRVTTAATGGGSHQAPVMVEEIGAAYDLKATLALEKSAEGIGRLVQAASEAAKRGAPAVRPYLDTIASLTRGWDRLAQPVQLLAKSRGIEHEASTRLAHQVRSLNVHIVNEYDFIKEAAALTQVLSEVFTEVPEVVETLESDGDHLKGMALERERKKKGEREWAAKVTYSVEIGSLSKKTFSISPSGVSWKEHHYALEAIARLRWGATRHSINGIPTGTTYAVAVGDAESELVCTMRLVS